MKLHKKRIFELVEVRALGSTPSWWTKADVDFLTKKGLIDADGLTVKGRVELEEAEKPKSILGRVGSNWIVAKLPKGIGESWMQMNGAQVLALSEDGRTTFVQWGWRRGADSIIAVETVRFAP